MERLQFNLDKHGKKFKILNATNGGPWHKRHADDQYRSNFADYKAAKIPYSRNHDSAVQGIYGGPYSHDITMIFPNFDADPTDPASYDFACTDESILVCLDAGTQTFFRLGQTIEHQIKKHGTLPPADFKKWAVICEHIIRHYNEGWADGYTLGIEYWEIWNEPDLDPDDSDNKRTWGGTKAEFFDLYEIAAKHLKSKFPQLKIGGPAIAHDEKWAEDFLCEMKKRDIPLDFFSWHIYCTEPEHMVKKAERIKSLLLRYGYDNTESILNEWNYIRGWTDDYIYSIKAIHGIKGAAFVMACICEAQATSIDMLMYYDTRPSCFNGAFDYYTYEKLKGYYPLYWYGKFYDAEKEIPALNRIDNIYSLCGVDKNGKVLAVITHYNENDAAEEKSITVDFGRGGSFEIYLLDESHDAELIGTTDTLDLTLRNFSSVLIKEL
ncbi:MAG: hypothetical protein IKV49_00805 [Clostridia bacterium]|nr:hypothetical protein [Clostridia bacterium]